MRGRRPGAAPGGARLRSAPRRALGGARARLIGSDSQPVPAQTAAPCPRFAPAGGNQPRPPIIITQRPPFPPIQASEEAAVSRHSVIRLRTLLAALGAASLVSM